MSKGVIKVCVKSLKDACDIPLFLYMDDEREANKLVDKLNATGKVNSYSSPRFAIQDCDTAFSVAKSYFEELKDEQ